MRQRSPSSRRDRVAWLCMALLLILPVAVKAQEEDTGGRIAFAAFVEGNWDIYSIGADGSDFRRHTFDPADDLAPTWSPDGGCMAFQSHRDGNWEIYRLCDSDAEPTQLTHSLAFDGRPTWSPQGDTIAFDSFRSGDLDIFVMDGDGGGVVDLTEDSSAGDFGPAWSPDGRRLAFTSWRNGDLNIFVVAAEGGEVQQLTNSPEQKADPTWSSPGRGRSPQGSLAYTAHLPDTTSEVYRLDVGQPPMEGGRRDQLTWWGGVVSPVWSPDGVEIAALWQRFDGEILIVFDTGGGLPQQLTGTAMLAGPLSWTAEQLPWGQSADLRLLTDPRWETPPPGDRTLVTVPDVDVSNPRLNSAVVPAFNALRQMILERSGYDFMAALSDMWRNPDYANEGSDYLSWHKAGRAVDLLWDYRASDGTPLLEMVPQSLGGEMYWRLYLRCREQNGSQGEPLTVQTWNFSPEARAVETPATGGFLNSAIPYGYYVDLTTLIRQYGWERISSHDEPEFHWHGNFRALEYWHIQHRGGLSWYAAMQEVYDNDLLQSYFDVTTVAARGEDPWRIFAKGIPYSPDGRPWWALGN